MLAPLTEPGPRALRGLDQSLVQLRHAGSSLLVALLLDLVEHGLEIASLRELLRGGTGQVLLVGAEHSGHLLLAHVEKLAGSELAVGVGAYALPDEVAPPSHRLVAQHGVHGEVVEARVAQRAPVSTPQDMLHPPMQGHRLAARLAQLLEGPVIPFPRLEDLGEGGGDVPGSVLAHQGLAVLDLRPTHHHAAREARRLKPIEDSLLPLSQVLRVELLLLLLRRALRPPPRSGQHATCKRLAIADAAAGKAGHVAIDLVPRLHLLGRLAT